MATPLNTGLWGCFGIILAPPLNLYGSYIRCMLAPSAASWPTPRGLSDRQGCAAPCRTTARTRAGPSARTGGNCTRVTPRACRSRRAKRPSCPSQSAAVRGLQEVRRSGVLAGGGQFEKHMPGLDGLAQAHLVGVGNQPEVWYIILCQYLEIR